MEKKNFKNCDELAAYMVEQIDGKECVTAVLFYNDARVLLGSLLEFPYVEAAFVELETPEYGGYEKEYFVTLDSENMIWVEKAYKFERYLSHDADIMLIDGDASSQIIMDGQRAVDYEISLGEETDKDKSKEVSKCDYHKDEDGTITIKIHPVDCKVDDWLKYDPFWHDPFFRTRFPLLF